MVFPSASLRALLALRCCRSCNDPQPLRVPPEHHRRFESATSQRRTALVLSLTVRRSFRGHTKGTTSIARWFHRALNDGPLGCHPARRSDLAPVLFRVVRHDAGEQWHEHLGVLLHVSVFELPQNLHRGSRVRHGVQNRPKVRNHAGILRVPVVVLRGSFMRIGWSRAWNDPRAGPIRAAPRSDHPRVDR